MKRDDEFIRKIMLDMEADDGFWLIIADGLMPCDEEDAEKFIYHTMLLCDAGLLIEARSGQYRLSSHGHDYLDAVRDNTIWQKTINGAQQVGGMTLGMMRDLALAYVRQEATQRLGIEL